METVEDVLMEGLGATREQAESLHQWVFDSFTDDDCDQLRIWLSDSYARLYESYEEYEANEDTTDQYLNVFNDLSYGVLVYAR